MPVERPTFSETWYRVAELRPRLRSTVQIHRQWFRGRMWHVIQDPANNQFFRLNRPAYHFVGMLDGRRTVSEVWDTSNEVLGDEAPTQGEVIQLLGQLYASNLIQADLPPDAEGLFKRYRRRVRREIQGYLTNFLFIRIPLLDPDRFLNRTVKIFGLVFSKVGLVLWLVLLGLGIYAVGSHLGGLWDARSRILDPENLPLLYLSFVFVKVFHEFGHAFACKKFGQASGDGGEVHVMGVMFLVFTPLPYVDASSAYALRSKWHRVVIGAAGMMVELGIAAVAALVWASTSEGTLHTICYNIMFIASVSSLLFNGNPLLRYDGYYILSDLLEMPNLWTRGREYLYYVVRKYVWGVRGVRNPAHTPGEKFWLPAHALGSTIYRVFILVAILLFIAGKLKVLGIGLAIGAAVVWLLVPLGKFFRYLFTSPELMRVRARAVATTFLFLALVVTLVGVIPFDEHQRLEGELYPVRMKVVYAGEDGVITGHAPTGSRVAPKGAPLVTAANDRIETALGKLRRERRSLVYELNLAVAQDNPTLVRDVRDQIATLDRDIRRLEDRLAALRIEPPIAGVWVAPDVDQRLGQYVRRGDELGAVLATDELVIRGVAPQEVAAQLFELFQGTDAVPVELRLKGRADRVLAGVASPPLPAGREELPSPALGIAGGGAMRVAPEDQQGTRAAENFFEIRVRPVHSADVELLPGQIAVMRFDLPAKPLALQWWQSLLQLIQRRLGV